MINHTSQFFLYDSELLDIRSAFNHYQSLGTCALIKTICQAFSCLVVLYNSIHPFQFKSNHDILLNNTFKSFWMINVIAIHILISYTINYSSLIIPNIHFHML